MAIHTFKAGTKHYEFFKSGDHSEIYEASNPREGFIFESDKQLIAFVNQLTDVIDEEVK